MVKTVTSQPPPPARQPGERSPRRSEPSRRRAGWRLLAARTLLSAGPAAAGTLWTPAEGAELIGTRAPPWTGIEWLQGGPLQLSQLKGKVVLVRFWAMDCPYCTATLPALEALHRKDKDRGLVVVGIHHPKSDDATSLPAVREAVKALGLSFPVGVDNAWSTVQAYGVGTHFQRFTSISVLIDGSGVIRFVHDGGELHPGGGAGHEACNAAWDALERALEPLLR